MTSPQEKQWIHDHPTLAPGAPAVHDDPKGKRQEDKIIRSTDLEPLHHPGHHDQESDVFGSRQWGHDHPTELLHGHAPQDNLKERKHLDSVLTTADIEPLHHAGRQDHQRNAYGVLT